MHHHQVFNYNYYQCWGSGIRCFFDPGSGYRLSFSGSRIPNPYFWELRKNFGLKILAGRCDNSMSELTLSPGQDLWIRLQVSAPFHPNSQAKDILKSIIQNKQQSRDMQPGNYAILHQTIDLLIIEPVIQKSTVSINHYRIFGNKQSSVVFCSKLNCNACRQCFGAGSVESVSFGSPRAESEVRIQIRILSSSSKNNKKNLYLYCFLTSYDFLSLKNDGKVISKEIFYVFKVTDQKSSNRSLIR